MMPSADVAPIPAPIRVAALETVARLTEELIAHGAVDGATGDALDGLIDAWLAQWRAQLDREVLDRQSAVLRSIGSAQNEVAVAQGRAAATHHALEEARAAYALSTTSESLPVKQVSNGVHAPAAH
jgi:hypothetical protein